ncbi:MAG: tRNA adenosine(34) deaminase TadA [Balneolaceae bacterium]
MFNGKESHPLKKHTAWMLKALRLAEQAAREGEIPVGAIIIRDNQLIGKGYNQTELLNDPTAHAEMLAISAACNTIGEKYLNGCTLYVTLEPCPMCAGAIMWSKIDRIVFGLPDERAGACGTLFNISNNKKLNHRSEVIQGVLEEDCRDLLQIFFKNRRNRK